MTTHTHSLRQTFKLSSSYKFHVLGATRFSSQLQIIALVLLTLQQTHSRSPWRAWWDWDSGPSFWCSGYGAQPENLHSLPVSRVLRVLVLWAGYSTWRSKELYFNSIIQFLSGFCLVKMSQRTVRKPSSPSPLVGSEHCGSACIAGWSGTPFIRPPGPTHQRGLIDGVVIWKGRIAGPGEPRNRVNDCHASMTILRPGIYVTGTQSLNSQGQRGIWVNRKLKMELKWARGAPLTWSRTWLASKWTVWTRK